MKQEEKVKLYQELLLQKKNKGLNDLYFFNKYILEESPVRRELIVPHVHGEWATWFSDSNQRIKCILVPRSSFKSTFFTVGWTLQLLAQNQSNRILIANATIGNSQNFLGEIKNHIRKNETYKMLYGDLYDKNLKWTDEQIEIRGRSLNMRESNVTATGVGGNLVSQHYDYIICLSPETLVLTSNGYLKAKEIREGHRVLSSDGRFHSIEAVKTRKVKKRQVTIRSYYQPHGNSFTTDHPILAWRNDSFKWIEAGNLKASDRLVIPRCFALNRQPSKVNGRINRLMQQEDIWRLIGYWLAEGCYTKEGSQIRMTFSDKEIEFVKDIEKIVKKYLNVPFSFRKTKSSTFILYFSDPDFKKIIRKFGTKSFTKHLPPLAINQSANKQRELIKGYFRGDGCICRNVVNFSSTSLSLLTGFQLILAKFGIPSSILKGAKAGKAIIVGNECNIRDSWHLNSTHPILKLILGIEASVGIKPIRSFFTDKYWVVPIREIRQIKDSKKVVDIQVKGTKNFYCPGMIVHNCDDLVNLENSATRYQSEKVIDWWKRSLSLLEPTGIDLVVGTRWSYYELYHYLKTDLSDEVDMFKRSAHNPDGSLYFPERFDEKKLAELKKLHGSYIYSSFYENDPIDPDTAIIKPSQIKYFTESDGEKSKSVAILPDNVIIFIAVDPAVTEGKLNDYSGFIIAAVDQRNNWYVLEARREKVSVGEMINLIFDLNKNYKPDSISLEVIGQGQALTNSIQVEEDRRGVYLPIVEIKGQPMARKEMRIRSILQPRFERGKIYIKKEQDDLLDELLHFPLSAHDDLIDALSQIEDIAYSPGNKKEKKVKNPKSKLIARIKTKTDRDIVDEFLGEDY